MLVARATKESVRAVDPTTSVPGERKREFSLLEGGRRERFPEKGRRGDFLSIASGK